MTGWRAAVAGLAVALVALAPARADEAAPLDTYIAEGAVGAYPAGLNVTVRDHTQAVAAHYYYASTGRDIPLRIAQDGEWITLTEPGGPRLLLRLTNADPATKHPLTFYTSTGVAGDWTDGIKVFPARFGFGTVRAGPSPTRWYGDVTTGTDAAFEATCRRFLDGVIRGDRAKAATAVSYPLRVNGPVRLTLRNRAELLAQWRRVFTPAAVERLRKAIPHEMFVRDGMAMVANGAVWFDARGAKALNLP